MANTFSRNHWRSGLNNQISANGYNGNAQNHANLNQSIRVISLNIWQFAYYSTSNLLLSPNGYQTTFRIFLSIPSESQFADPFVNWTNDAGNIFSDDNVTVFETTLTGNNYFFQEFNQNEFIMNPNLWYFNVGTRVIATNASITIVNFAWDMCYETYATNI